MGLFSSSKTNVTNYGGPSPETVRTQNRKELANALMNAGKIEAFDVRDEEALDSVFAGLADEGINLANPFPDFLEGTGDMAIEDIIKATENVTDFQDRFNAAKLKIKPLEDTADRGTEVIGDVFDPDGMEADFRQQNENLREINEGLKALNVREAATDSANQASVLSAGDAYSKALGETGEDSEQLLREKENILLENAGNVGDIMRRNAFTQRRASEDAANQALQGLRSLGIGQGTGTNMRSAMMQNRARQAQDMAEPMGLADLFQTAEEADIKADSITDIITAREGRDLAAVSSAEAALNNELRALGYGDAEIQAAKTNLGLDLTAEEDERNLYRDLFNMRLGNLGLVGSQAELLNYLASADDALAFADTDEILKRTEPYTARGTAPAPSGAYYSQSYTAPREKRSTLDKIIDLANYAGGGS